MNPTQLSSLLVELLALPQETEWVEWKHNNNQPEMIAERLSGLANSAALHGKETAYMLWGIEDGTKNIVGTTFKPRQAKKGNEELENWLMRSLHPQVNFKMHEWDHQDRPLVLFEIPRATRSPVRFAGEPRIRIGSLTKKLKDYPNKEAELWATFAQKPFERGIARSDLAMNEVLALLDFQGCFDLLKITLPTDQQGILSKLAEEHLVISKPGRRFDITNLGAMLFAKDLSQFDRLGRKALRIIKYVGDGRTETEREWRDAPSQKGYAVAFEAAVAYINSQLPQNEPIGLAFSSEERMYPEKAIRELIANALIHQEFSITGAGPMVEIFSQRLEITNPGEPLVDTQRFIDTPPRSRNEDLAALMRRMRICEEAGTGIDKVIATVEAFQLPAPDFRASGDNTIAVLYGPRTFAQMDREERVRACYQHACLQYVSGSRMTNASLRKRLGIKDSNYPMASRIIKDSTEATLIKPHGDGLGSRKGASYVPFWA